MMSWTDFPRNLGKKAFRWLFIFYITTLVAIGASLRMFIHQNIDLTSPWVNGFLEKLDHFLIYVFWTLIAVSLVFFALFVWNFFSPLGVLVKKAKYIRRGIFKKKEGAVLSEDRGEWYLLDLTLNKINRDLKKRKADVARERGELEAIVTAANDAILAVDQDQNIRYYNTPMALLLDQKEEGSWGKTLNEVFRNPKVITAMEEAMMEDKVQRVQITHQLNFDSSVRYYEVSISPLRGPKKNKSLGAVAIFHDITEHKKVEKVRMDFVANASHELKTPVTSIQGYLSLVKEKVESQDPSLVPVFATLNKNIKRLDQLIGDLLHLTKIEGSEDVQKEFIGLQELTESIFDELKPQSEGKNHKVYGEYKTDKLLANREYLEQTLINLIENAMKYCPEGSEIRVRWSRTEDGTLLSVKDNGPGIESYHLGRLFERFYRVRDDKNQNLVSGTGLGLSIVRHAMIKQGGTVDVKSAPGLGTEFVCLFPNNTGTAESKPLREEPKPGLSFEA